MARNLFWKQVLTDQSAQDAAGQVPLDQIANVREMWALVFFGAGCSAGAVVLEDAHDPAFTGTWSNNATVNWSAANKVTKVAITGGGRALRARISTAVVGGVVNVYIGGN